MLIALLVSATTRADPGADLIPNALVKRMYERRAASQRRQASIATAVGTSLIIAGSLTTSLLLGSSDSHARSLVFPWVVEAEVLGLCVTLAGAGANGRIFVERASQIDPNGSTPRAALLAEERSHTNGGPRVLAIALATGLSVMAIGAGTIVLGEYGSPPGADKTAYFTSGAAIASLGAVVSALGVSIWVGLRRERARLDAGIIDDLDPATTRVTLAPFGLRGGGGLGLAGTF